MLESVGPVGYVIRKLNQMRENVSSSQSRFEAIEIIEALILALVAVATAWSGYQAAQWAGQRAEEYAKAVGSPLSSMGKSKRRSSSSGVFETNTDRHSQHG